MCSSEKGNCTLVPITSYESNGMWLGAWVLDSFCVFCCKPVKLDTPSFLTPPCHLVDLWPTLPCVFGFITVSSITQDHRPVLPTLVFKLLPHHSSSPYDDRLPSILPPPSSLEIDYSRYLPFLSPRKHRNRKPITSYRHHRKYSSTSPKVFPNTLVIRAHPPATFCWPACLFCFGSNNNNNIYQIKDCERVLLLSTSCRKHISTHNRPRRPSPNPNYPSCGPRYWILFQGDTGGDYDPNSEPPNLPPRTLPR